MTRWIVLLLVVLSPLGFAQGEQITIEITETSPNPTPIAVVPFGWASSGAPPEDFAEVIQGDFTRVGQFAPIDRADMLGFPDREEEIFFRDWRALSTDYVLIGRASADGEALTLRYELYDVVQQKRIDEGDISGPVSESRMLAHRVADAVHETLPGIPRAFATRLLYVSVTRNPTGKDDSRLTPAHSHGAPPALLPVPPDPILPPSASPW